MIDHSCCDYDRVGKAGGTAALASFMEAKYSDHSTNTLLLERLEELCQAAQALSRRASHK